MATTAPEFVDVTFFWSRPSTPSTITDYSVIFTTDPGIPTSDWQLGASDIPAMSTSTTVRFPRQGVYDFFLVANAPGTSDFVGAGRVNLTMAGAAGPSSRLYPHSISWTPIPGLPIQSYLVDYRPAGSTQWRQVASVGSGVTSRLLQLPAGSYEYRVRATLPGSAPLFVNTGEFEVIEGAFSPSKGYCW